MEDPIKDSNQPPREQTEKKLFSASNQVNPETQAVTLKLEDSPVKKMAGCLSTDYYNITFKCRITKQHLGKFLDFLLNAEWKDQWGGISIDEILKVEKAEPPVYTNFSEES